MVTEDVGLSLSYRLSLNGLLFWVLYTSCFVENRMVSVERIKQFTNIPSKAEWVKKDKSPPPNWPTHGSLELRNLQVTRKFYHHVEVLTCGFGL
ncbi:putative ABC-type xenobiotic transporter [Helianthus annuus]|uniref:ABC-type xenobiotic transporter n=1 Tax=Helianthus annuus TaxID=4232 RepID=A0A9K3ENM4_HELAN|nr:putative ABC-type xenobiotic transporter [Helianthus annuus]KAJ0860107.1 putative ABC-type xenobiotic transporter [Helianthus annuus]